MNRFFTGRPWKRLLILTVFFLIASEKSEAQYNPYNMHTQFSSHMFYDYCRDAEKRLMAHKMYNRAKDAGDGQNGIMRLETSYGTIITTAEYNLNYRISNFDGSEFPYDDTTVSLKTKPKFGFHSGISGGYPCATISENGAIVFSVGMQFDYLNWSQPEFEFMGDKKAFEFKSWTVGFPITFDYKNGAEAMLDRAKRTCFTVGLGVQPSVAFSRVEGKDQNTFTSFLPAGKVEFGYATSFATFKLRATGLLGHIQYIDFTDVHDGRFDRTYDISVTGGSQIILALVIMPMTSRWENDAWYRQ